MKRLLLFVILPCLASCAWLGGHPSNEIPPRMRISFNAGWSFAKDDPSDARGQLDYDKLKSYLLPTGNAFVESPVARPDGNPGADVSYVKPDFDDSAWRKLDLPHDWGIEGPFKQEYAGESGKLPSWGVGWYRKHFEVAADDRGQKVFMDVDGAMSHAAVWLNGHFIGGWPFGYASWQVDLTPYLHFGGMNVIAIRLDNPNDSSRWYPGGGIYRNVWLEKTSPIHVTQWGTQVITKKIAGDSATIEIDTQIANESPSAARVQVETSLVGAPGSDQPKGEGQAKSAVQEVRIAAGDSATVTQTINVPNPQKWSIDEPALYCAVVRIKRGGSLVDLDAEQFGIRTAEFTATDGFHLNGKRVPLNGVCMHHDLGELGSAVNSAALERRLKILKEMGCNAIRTSHNPPAPELIELCDRMGFVVMAEAFDAWHVKKKKNDYHLMFDDWSERDMRSLVRHYRNNPSVVLWSIGNEIVEQGKPEVIPVAKRLTAFAHAEDPSRPVTIAVCRAQAVDVGLQHAVDVFGSNYFSVDYGKFITQNPNIPYFSSESASTVSSRGEYFFDTPESQRGYQVDSYDLAHPKWATTADDEFRWLDTHPTMAGEFVWTGFDYLGEPTPNDKPGSPSRSSYFGINDLAGFKKDRFYLYQARWRPDLPMAHILPHWTWPGREHQVIPVHVYTNGDEAELFVNGDSMGVRKKGPFEYRLRWDNVNYEPGELKVVVKKTGKAWAEDTVKTAGPAAQIELSVDRSELHADADDLAFVTAKITDADGNLVPRADNLITFSATGPGDVIATDNGDATSHASFQAKECKAYNGLCLAVVRPKRGAKEKITVTAAAAGLKPMSIELLSQ